MSSPCNHRSLCLVLHEFVGQWSLNHLNVHMPTQPMQAVTEGPCPHSVTVVRKTGIQPVTLMMGRAEGWGCGQNAARACSQQSHQCSRLCFIGRCWRCHLLRLPQCAGAASSACELGAAQ